MQYPVIAQPTSAFAPTFAGGGMTNAAQAVQSQGRGKDTMLVHMTPNEVRGLQALAMSQGGSLTINPTTGLPEAGFLESILPMIAGFALGPAGFGIFKSALGAGLAVGGVTALATGDLGKGLMAGLGAFGGADIGAALSSTGTQAVQSRAMMDEVSRQIAQDAANAQSTLAGTSLPISGTQAGADAILAAAQNAPTGFSSVGAGVKDLFSTGGIDRFGAALSQQAGGRFGATARLAGTAMPIVNAMQPTYEFPSVEEATSNYAGPYTPSERRVRYPGAERDKEDSSEFLYFSPTNPYPGFVSAASGGSIGYQEGGTVEVPAAPERMLNMPAPTYMHGTAPEFNYNFRPVEVYTPPPAAAPAQGQNVFGAMFGGNLFNKASPNGDSEEMRTDTEGSGLGSIFKGIFKRDREKEEGNYTDLSKYKYDAATQRMVPTTTDMAQGGLAGLNAFNKGGAPKGRFLRGPGDGTSDSIPATIGGTQPARLADGEFVIDARTVSEIGNGSSKAGAKKLYAMMERVHKARKGAKRGQNSNADRYFPA